MYSSCKSYLLICDICKYYIFKCNAYNVLHADLCIDYIH